MKNIPYLPIRLVLCSIALFHGLLGFCGLFLSGERIKIIAAVYGASLTITPQVDYIIRIAAAYMIFAAILGIFAIANPEKNKAIIYGLIVLMTARFVGLVICAKQEHEIFNVAYSKITLDGILFVTLIMLLLVFIPKKATT